jgi:hypothetical protein
MASKEQYEAPELQEIGDMTQLTQQFGWGFLEAVVSALFNPGNNGSIGGSNFS